MNVYSQIRYSSLLALQCPRKSTVRRSALGNTGHRGDELKVSEGDTSKVGESGRPTWVKRVGPRVRTTPVWSESRDFPHTLSIVSQAGRHHPVRRDPRPSPRPRNGPTSTSSAWCASKTTSTTTDLFPLRHRGFLNPCGRWRLGVPHPVRTRE